MKRYYIPTLQVGSIDTLLQDQGPLHFLALGDTGKGNDHQFMVAKALENYCETLPNLHGILLLGDNFYPRGVKGVDDPQWEEKVENPYGSKCLSKAPIFAILGNHDYRGNANAQVAYSEKNPRWHMPHRFYRVLWPGLLNLIAIDTNFPDYCGDAQTCVSDFMQSRLDPSLGFNIILGHHPLYSSSALDFEHRWNPASLWLKPIACQGANLWLSGHSHHLEYRSIPGCMTHIAVSGGGGGPLSGLQGEEAQEVQYAKGAFGFLHLEVDANRLQLKFIDTDGQKLFGSELNR